jgi:glycosyltransferase involved in cell wall biosynthesis
MSLRVLYLTPPALGTIALAAQSFIEEEIRAVARCGVDAVVLTDDPIAPVTLDRVELVGMPRGRVSDFPSLALLAARHSSHWRTIARVVRASPRPHDVVHALRIEAAAARLVVERRIDVIHSHFGWPAGYGGSLAARITGRPLIASLRGTDILLRPEIGYGLRRNPAYDVALRHLLRTASVILTATPFMHARALELGAPVDRLQILEKGVDADAFRAPVNRAQARQALGVSGPLILGVGGLKRRKGFDVIVDAMASLSRADVTLVICGDGEERQALEQRAASLGISSRVRFEGHVGRERIAGYFAGADVFVHAAELEAAGNVVLEALASECAVVVADSGGPSEYVENGLTGFVVPVRDVTALAGRLEELLRDEPLRLQVARAGRRRVEQRHQYSRMIADLCVLYARQAANATEAAPSG